MSCSCNPCCSVDLSAYNCSEICTAIYVQNSFNVPACGATAVIDIPKLKTIIVGGYLWNPTYGYFLIQSFNAVTGQAQILNECITGNAAPGTIVPASTQFAVTPLPLEREYDGGWINPIVPPGVFTYASPTTITVPSDATLTYQKGDKLRLVQGAVTKYFYIVDVTSSTSITITGGSDYTLTNAVISDPVISREDVPFGFPDSFNYVPTFVGFSVDPVVSQAVFSIKGSLCLVSMYTSANGTSNAVTYEVSPPVPPSASPFNTYGTCAYSATNNGVVLTTPARVFVQSGTANIVLYKDLANATWTAAGAKKADFQLWYRI